MIHYTRKGTWIFEVQCRLFSITERSHAHFSPFFPDAMNHERGS
jgi:hypothetical protein